MNEGKSQWEKSSEDERITKGNNLCCSSGLQKETVTVGKGETIIPLGMSSSNKSTLKAGATMTDVEQSPFVALKDKEAPMFFKCIASNLCTVSPNDKIFCDCETIIP